MAAVCLLGFLFMRSVRNSLQDPYAIPAGSMSNWRLVIDPAAGPGGPLLLLQPPGELTRFVFSQVFKRVMESMEAPAIPALPLLLRGEYQAAFAGRLTPETLLEEARAAGLDGETFHPRCLAHRRVSEPTGTQQLYFVLFESPAFQRFRQRLATLATAGGGVIDAGALSPVLFIAVSESAFDRWLPLRADPAADRVAPIILSRAR